MTDQSRAQLAQMVGGLFRPFEMPGLSLANRIVMAPMTRCLSPGGVPGPDVAAYYRRRAEGGTGLIITEGTWIPHPSAGNDPNAPRFYGADALAGWARVVAEVHAAGGKIMPQLWHVGQTEKVQLEGIYEDKDVGTDRQIGPSGMVGGIGIPPTLRDTPATLAEIEAVGDAYVTAAASARHLGFDGVEIHAAHGYLFDQFFWNETNRRTDHFGGDLAARTRFAADIVRGMRQATAPDFPIVLRISQWKLQDYTAKLTDSPAELEAFLAPLADAGATMFHCSQRRFWEGEFGTDRNLAAWVKQLTGRPTITVGSVTLKQDLAETMAGADGAPDRNLDLLVRLLDRGDFDLVAIGRSLITNPDWSNKVRAGAQDELRPYTASALATLA